MYFVIFWISNFLRLLLLSYTLSYTLIPYMWQMVFAHISIKGWIIDPYVQNLFYCSYQVQVLPRNSVKVVDGNIVTSDVAVVIYGRRGFQMFLEPFSKSSWGLSNVLFITIHPVTLIYVDDSTLLLDWIFVFGRHQEVLDGGASFKVHYFVLLFNTSELKLK